MLSEFDIEMLPRILGGHGDWFTAELLRLITHADVENREKLRKAFPAEVALVDEYQFNPNSRWARS